MLKKFFGILLGVSVASVISSGVCQVKSENNYNNSSTPCSIAPDPTSTIYDLGGSGSYSNVVSFYYGCLSENYGFNYKGTCTHMAIGLLLSYYDTFLNDSIIPEDYDIPSIGSSKDLIKRNNNPGFFNDKTQSNEKNVSEMTNGEYLERCRNMQEYSLHARLIMFGDEKNFYGDSKKDLSLNHYEMMDEIELYFNTLSNFKKNKDYEFLELCYQNDGSKSQIVRNYAIDLIKKGYPVILWVRSGKLIQKDNGNWVKEGGHVVVAYQYNEEENELYCHTGWHSKTAKGTPESLGYPEYVSALAIKFNIPYSPSDNYGLSFYNGNIEYFSADKITDDFRLEHKHNYSSSCGDNHDMKCICGNKITNHNYTDHYEKYNDEHHKAYCRCGCASFKKHSYTDHYKNNGPTQHYAYCVCGEYVEEDHSYGDHFEKYNKKQHKAYCACGAYVLRPHVAKSTPMSGLRGLRYAVCEDCGELVDLGSTPIIAYI